MPFIYETYDTVSRSGFKDFRADLPDYHTKNLKHPLRPYQQEAIGRYLHYKTDNNRVIPEQVLYNMATGSGKTLLMAAIILEKYQQGERNFIFFVNNDNILTKTKDNFLESASGKYLFAEKIVMDGRIVTVREVTDFSDSRDDSINIVFTTIQKLHQDLNTPRENRLSYEQFKDISVVMLADEAHHLNAGLSKSEKDDNTSWTSTIEMIQKTAKKSSIFEFTATIDLTNPILAQKYEKSLLFKYDLKEFRLDKYSKDVLFHLVDGDVNHRMLQAIIISQYRKKIALKNGINLKPLVMFKSQKIAESQENLDAFLGLLDNLSLEDIQAQRELVLEMDEKFSILKKAFSYFETVGITDTDLVAELQEDFRKERLLLVDGKNKNKDSLNLLNTLEQPSNEIRAIFTVDMLNEGWDVLNLFDIVRLYDTRDGKTTKNGFVAGKTTNTEKQLIGRGARYYPFVIGDNLEEKYTRKFDNNENNELRVIEQLHYHSANNPKYISELKQVLRESGILESQNLVERELKLKDSFKNTRTYTDGLVWMNKRLSYEQMLGERQESLFDTSFIPKSFEVKLPIQGVRDIEAFDEAMYVSESLEVISFKFGKVIGHNIVRAAINRNKKFTFDNLQKAFVALGSVSAFIDMLADIDIRVESQYQMISDFTPDDKLYITEKLLHVIEKDLIATEERYFGSEKFEQYKIKDLFEDNILRKYTIKSNGNKEMGLSQKDPNNEIHVNIDVLDWYAYDDNFGTDEEKYLVKTIQDVIGDLEEKWTDIYLLRNEKAVKIYSFDKGQAFEPDFLMFANDKRTGNISWQIFIEPKGKQLIEHDRWKEEFLLQISERDEARTLVDDDRYRIVGLPFFNEAVSKDEVKEELRRL
ncbi:DEAD/DEAH box helicase family protein [Streptococcus suis]|uniref:DEAD/DEAH box helicase family protein n=1 Tax=Streptococcus suis TaxID=1307 RepID=UPI0007C1D6EA|nr:DEAD/DEAH box helicase family protein [Streptococcus suis]AND00199.1 restriction endonuclease [Streptococcus suis]AOM74917.1 restriction endonuclease [Streptococcus suis]MBS8057804.1 DEAD/DEAH box helicase [Streptococcus suis]MBS8113176.1 DEAD/DEAH box helicase [Streptococcus suis]MCH1643439.1 DEAD/DEAH box helicase family protein [Streptococcus suis]